MTVNETYQSTAICEFCQKDIHELCDDNVDFPCVCCGIEWPPVLTQWDREVKADKER
jgi:hypothetical protein